MNYWDRLETPLNQAPTFFVEEPDGRKDWAEIDRQATFFKLLRLTGPRVLAYPNVNAGKRNPRLARKEGIVAGVFDVTCAFRPSLTAWIEFKGYDKSGRAGKLSQSQIDFGNRLIDLGRPCACFFSPDCALGWLRELGFPIRSADHAA